MPRRNREYLLRYIDQCVNDLDRSLERLKLLSDAYAGIRIPMQDEPMPEPLIEPDEYEGPHGKYQQYVDIQAQLLMVIRENLITFRTTYM